MMAGMDDKDDLEDEITLEAMSGLAKILAKLDENNVRQILINICLRIRPCFEKVGVKNKTFITCMANKNKLVGYCTWFVLASILLPNLILPMLAGPLYCFFSSAYLVIP